MGLVVLEQDMLLCRTPGWRNLSGTLKDMEEVTL